MGNGDQGDGMVMGHNSCLIDSIKVRIFNQTNKNSTYYTSIRIIEPDVRKAVETCYLAQLENPKSDFIKHYINQIQAIERVTKRQQRNRDRQKMLAELLENSEGW